MFFECDNLNFELIDVLSFDQFNTSMQVPPRPFCALSLRIEADTVLEYSGKIEHIVSSDIAFFPAGVPYKRRAIRDKMIVFHFNLLGEMPETIEILHGISAEDIEPLFESALAEWNTRRPGYRYRASACLYSVFAELQKKIAKQNPVTSKPVSKAIMHMLSEFSNPLLSIHDIAESIHMSESQFRLIFKKEVGVSPKQYLSDLRFEHARSLLAAGYDSVSSVSEKVGYADSKNFATAFRKKYGYPPSKEVMKN